MNLSKRERYAALAALLMVAVLLLDQYVLSPVLNKLETARTEKDRLAAELDQAEALFHRQRIQAERWQRMVESGMRRTPEAAESAMFHALREWSGQSGLAMSSLKPGKSQPVGESDMVELTFQLAGSGNMRSVARFLWSIENAAMPVKLQQVTIGSRRDGVDDLSLQIRLSSICLPPQAAHENESEVNE